MLIHEETDIKVAAPCWRCTDAGEAKYGVHAQVYHGEKDRILEQYRQGLCFHKKCWKKLDKAARRSIMHCFSVHTSK